MWIVMLALIVMVAGAAGGALAGAALAGKHLGTQIAGALGAFYGLTGTAPAAVLFAIYLAVARH